MAARPTRIACCLPLRPPTRADSRLRSDGVYFWLEPRTSVMRLSVLIPVHRSDCPSGHCTTTASTAADVSEAEVRPHVARGKIAAVGLDAAPEGRPSRSLHPDPRSEPEAVAGWLLEPDLEPVVARPRLVQQEPDGAVVVRDDDVGVAVVVDVSECGAAGHIDAP